MARFERQKVASALAVVAIALVAVLAILTTQLEGLRGGRSSLLSRTPLSILSVATALERDNVSPQVSVNTAAALSILQQLCGSEPGYNGISRESYAAVKRNRENWRDTLGAFGNAKEVQKAVMADTAHVHLLIYVAPSWCTWSRKEVYELHDHFHELGAGGARVHLLDADDPDNSVLMAWEGVNSYPTLVVVQGNKILSKVSGYQAFSKVRDMAAIDNDGLPTPNAY